MSTEPSDPSEPDRRETRFERADRNWDELMQELRVMQTGTQVLTGFLLAVAFQPRFVELDALQHAFYIVLVVLAALATILSLTPVGLHRVLFGRHRKPDLVRYGTRIVEVALIVVGTLTVGVTTFIVDFTVGRTPAFWALVISAVLVVLLWMMFWLVIRRGQRYDRTSPST